MIDSQLHFAVMFIITAVLCMMFRRQRGGLFAVLSIVTLIACGKELYDLSVNPWNLSVVELIDDTLRDLFFDGLGILFGTILWWR